MITKITPEQKAKIPEYLNYWLSIGLRTETIDRDLAKESINFMYEKILNISKPKHYIFLDSPMACQLFLNDSNQLGSQLWSQLGRQLEDQLENQLENQLGSQLWNQLRSQLRNQLGNQLENQLGDQLRNQLENQLRNQLNQLDNQLWNQLNQLDNQLDNQLRNQLGDQLRNQLRNQLYQLWDQLNRLWNQLDNRLWNQLRNQLGNQLRNQKMSFVYESKTNWAQAYYWYYFFILNEIIPEKKKDFDLFLKYVEYSKYYHHVYLSPEIAVFSDFPKVISLDSKGRLDNENGLALEYRDGYGFYASHGKIATTPLELELL